MPRRVAGLFFALLSCVQVTCTQSNVAKQQDAPLSPATFCARLREAQCTYRVRCGLAETAEGCAAKEAQWHGTPDCAPYAASVKDGRARFDASLAQSCLDDWANKIACERESLLVVSACAEATAGTGTDGSACTRAGDCSDAFYCDASAKLCPGACRARLGAGASAAEQGMCQSGLAFDYNEKKCVAKTAAGGGCTADFLCADGLACIDGKCAARLPEGGSCSTSNACSGVLQCSGGTCVAPSGMGGACKTLSDCPMDLGCYGDPKVCGALKPVGGSCGQDNECQATFYCADGLCAAAIREGGTCTAFGQCADGLYCNQDGMQAGSCAVLGKNGAPCKASGLGCAMGFACDPSSAVCKPSSCVDDTP